MPGLLLIHSFFTCGMLAHAGQGADVAKDAANRWLGG